MLKDRSFGNHALKISDEAAAEWSHMVSAREIEAASSAGSSLLSHREGGL